MTGYFNSFALIGSSMALATAPTSALAQDDEALIFEPTTAWVMDYQEQACALRKAFAGGGRTLMVQFKSQNLADDIDISLASGELETLKAQVTYQFLPDEKPREPKNPRIRAFDQKLNGVSFTGSMRAPVSDRKARMATWPRGERQQREASITGLLVTGAFERTVLVRTGSMDAAMDAMRNCVDDLLSGWGFNPRINDGVAVRASPVGFDLWHDRVMGASARRASSKRGLNMDFYYVVGVDGRVTQCRAANGKVDPTFAEAYCEAYERYGRFEPARDASGNDVQSISTSWVTLGPTLSARL